MLHACGPRRCTAWQSKRAAARVHPMHGRARSACGSPLAQQPRQGLFAASLRMPPVGVKRAAQACASASTAEAGSAAGCRPLAVGGRSCPFALGRANGSSARCFRHMHSSTAAAASAPWQQRQPCIYLQTARPTLVLFILPSVPPAEPSSSSLFPFYAASLLLLHAPACPALHMVRFAWLHFSAARHAKSFGRVRI